jgi:hypothetical protein
MHLLISKPYWCQAPQKDNTSKLSAVGGRFALELSCKRPLLSFNGSGLRFYEKF